MRGTNGGRRNAIPFRIEPARGQVSENSSNPPAKQSCDVFHENESGSYLANDPSEFGPQSASFAVNTCALPRVTNVLAREAAGDEVGDFGQALTGNSPHVFKPWHVRPMLRQHAPAKRVNLHLSHAPHPGTLQAKVDAADAGEQAKKRHAFTNASRRRRFSRRYASNPVTTTRGRAARVGSPAGT
jgi:hypothetical protein